MLMKKMEGHADGTDQAVCSRSYSMVEVCPARTSASSMVIPVSSPRLLDGLHMKPQEK